jgi:Fur family peroxide stress response transcriptional regulator
MNLKEKEPNISLATVYRNLTLLSEMGEIQRLDLGGGGDHFDAERAVHDHFICKECGCVLDLEAKDISQEITNAVEGFAGKIDGHVIYYYGLCPACCGSNFQAKNAQQEQ